MSQLLKFCLICLLVVFLISIFSNNSFLNKFLKLFLKLFSWWEEIHQKIKNFFQEVVLVKINRWLKEKKLIFQKEFQKEKNEMKEWLKEAFKKFFLKIFQFFRKLILKVFSGRELLKGELLFFLEYINKKLSIISLTLNNKLIIN